MCTRQDPIFYVCVNDNLSQPLAFDLMKFPMTPLTLPITILCQPTPPAFLQLGGQGFLTATAVPTQVGLSSRCERKTADVWGGIFAHCCRGGEFRQKRSDDVTIIALVRRDIED